MNTKLHAVADAEGRPWTCLEKVPVSLLFHAAFFSKATGLFPAMAECRRLGL